MCDKESDSKTAICFMVLHCKVQVWWMKRQTSSWPCVTVDQPLCPSPLWDNSMVTVSAATDSQCDSNCILYDYCTLSGFLNEKSLWLINWFNPSQHLWTYSNLKSDYIINGLKWLQVKGVCSQRARPIIAPIPLWSYLCVHLLSSALWDYTKSYWARGMAAKISRPELIMTNHQHKRHLSFSTKHKTDKKELSFTDH